MAKKFALWRRPGKSGRICSRKREKQRRESRQRRCLPRSPDARPERCECVVFFDFEGVALGFWAGPCRMSKSSKSLGPQRPHARVAHATSQKNVLAAFAAARAHASLAPQGRREKADQKTNAEDRQQVGQESAPAPGVRQRGACPQSAIWGHRERGRRGREKDGGRNRFQKTALVRGVRRSPAFVPRGEIARKNRRDSRVAEFLRRE